MLSHPSRRGFLRSAALATASLTFGAKLSSKPSTNSGGFFHLEKRGGRWWFITPAGEPFWSVGLNHVDSSTLRYVENVEIWHQKYGNDMEQWLQRVGTDMTDWGFNTLGWNQEVVVHNEYNNNHSRSFTFEEYQWLGLPYCHMLPFIESHQWETATRLPDVRSKSFADWCDYVARDQCARMRDDPNLIGYWYTDCPTWVHHRERAAWKGALFDADDLKTPTGRRELFDLVTAYNRVTSEAIRRYDPNHLIFGDRYEANAPLPDEVIQAAAPFVDVLGFQCFGLADHVGERLGYWAKVGQKPVLLADSAAWDPHTTTPGWPPREDRFHWVAGYADVTKTLQAIPECVGYHLCGAYLRNRVRRFGLRDEQDELDPSTLGIAEVNQSTADWVVQNS